MNKVFGIGLSRTATTSLSEAMRILGYNSLHTPRCIKDFWDYDFTGDHYTACRYKFLDHIFPDAKFIVTTREINSWLESNRIYFDEIVDKRYNGGVNLEVAALRFKLYNIIYYDNQALLSSFHKHTADIINHFKGRTNKLLFINICGGQGWETLCPFLNKEIPNKEFPILNIIKKTESGAYSIYHEINTDYVPQSDRGVLSSMHNSIENPEDSDFARKIEKKLRRDNK